VASRTRSRDSTSSNAEERSQLSAADGAEFWATIKTIEAVEATAAMDRRSRYRLARFLTRAVDGDAERVGLMLDHLVASGAPAGEWVRLAGEDLGLTAEEVRRLAGGKQKPAPKSRSGADR
jgi:hypothetical protein